MSTEIIEALGNHRFFAGLAAKDLERIANCGAFKTFPAGSLLTVEGESATTFFALLEGRAAILTSVPNRDPIVLQTLGSGAVIGWSWLDEQDWVFSVRAVTDCRVIALDATCLRPQLLADSAFGLEITRRFLRTMTSRLKATRLQLLDLYGQGNYGQENYGLSNDG